MLTVAEAIAHPHNLLRRAVRTIVDDAWGEITIPGMPIRFANHTDELPWRAQELGESNGPVLRRVLGMSDERIASLYDEGVLMRAMPVSITSPNTTSDRNPDRLDPQRPATKKHT